MLTWNLAIFAGLDGLALVPAGGRRWWIAGLVTILFAFLGYCARGVDASGAVAGAGVCFVLYAGTGPGGFLALVTVFLLTWIATRLGYARKQRLGVAEKRAGRKASQVLANLGVAAVCASIHIWLGSPIYLLGMTAALAEAASDTVSSEIGQAFRSQARMITNWKLVPAGTDGGMTLAGTSAGLAASCLVSGVPALLGVLSPAGFALCAGAGFAGMLVDSLLGGWLEQRGKLRNDTVNFLGTLTAAGLAMLSGNRIISL